MLTWSVANRAASGLQCAAGYLSQKLRGGAALARCRGPTARKPRMTAVSPGLSSIDSFATASSCSRATSVSGLGPWPWHQTAAPSRRATKTGKSGFGTLRPETRGDLRGREGKAIQRLVFSPDGRSLVSSTLRTGRVPALGCSNGTTPWKARDRRVPSRCLRCFLQGTAGAWPPSAVVSDYWDFLFVGFDITGVAGEMPFVELERRQGNRGRTHGSKTTRPR